MWSLKDNFFGFTEVTYHAILISRLLNMSKFIVGISKFTSSAYLTIILTSDKGWRSLAITSQRVGPRPDPWIMLLVIGNKTEIVWNTSIWCLAYLATTSKKCNNPIVNYRRNVKLTQLWQQYAMTNHIKYFWKIYRKASDIRVIFHHAGDIVCKCNYSAGRNRRRWHRRIDGKSREWRY